MTSEYSKVTSKAGSQKKISIGIDRVEPNSATVRKSLTSLAINQNPSTTAKRNKLEVIEESFENQSVTQTTTRNLSLGVKSKKLLAKKA